MLYNSYMLNTKDLNMIKMYLRVFFGIHITKWSKHIFRDTNINFFRKNGVSLYTMMKNYNLADAIELEMKEEVINNVVYKNGFGYYQSNKNPRLVLVVKEF
ncbi:MAG: hypothetical protein KDH96_12750 [Candidatus Riesia sp.]|nr:hypothetical protein [Candidatus Riesia sp.]